MTKNRRSKTGTGGKPPQASAPSGGKFEGVERVTEHVSSPFRWKILDVPIDEPEEAMCHKTKEQWSGGGLGLPTKGVP